MNASMHLRLPATWIALLFVLLIVFPPIASALGLDFYIGFMTRLLIFALVASSLNFILGFGGMVSLGHAAYFGTGAYVIGILMFHGLFSAWYSWPLAMLVGGALAFLIGAICLRTRGVYFIMITLAFAQMVYYIFVSLTTYGGDDGLPLPDRSTFFIDLNSDFSFYYVVLVVAAICMYVMYRLINSRFGRVMQAIRENETRAQAIGYPVYKYKLLAFTIAGAIAALGGALYANQNYMASPSQLHWMESGTLMVMVIIGGVGSFFGGAVGAVALLGLEEILAGYTTHWPFYLGLVLLAIVLFLPNGLASLPETIKKLRSQLLAPKKAPTHKGAKP